MNAVRSEIRRHSTVFIDQKKISLRTVIVRKARFNYKKIGLFLLYYIILRIFAQLYFLNLAFCVELSQKIIPVVQYLGTAHKISSLLSLHIHKSLGNTWPGIVIHEVPKIPSTNQIPDIYLVPNIMCGLEHIMSAN